MALNFNLESTLNALCLGSNNEVDDIYDPTSNISAEYGSFKEAKVDNSEQPHSFYIVYDKEIYGTAEGIATQSAFVPSEPLSGSSERVITPFTIVSCQGFDLRNPGIILFEHPNFIGNAKQYRTSQKDTTKSFKLGDNWSGVSSVIVTGGKWRLCSKKNFRGATIKILEQGIYTISGKYNDKVASVEKLGV